MAKLKALPKALIVACIVVGVGFVAYKFMPEMKPADPSVAPATRFTAPDNIATGKPTPSTPAPQVTPPPTSSGDVPAVVEAVKQAASMPEPQRNDSALDSLLGKGKK